MFLTCKRQLLNKRDMHGLVLDKRAFVGRQKIEQTEQVCFGEQMQNLLKDAFSARVAVEKIVDDRNPSGSGTHNLLQIDICLRNERSRVIVLLTISESNLIREPVWPAPASVNRDLSVLNRQVSVSSIAFVRVSSWPRWHRHGGPPPRASGLT